MKKRLLSLTSAVVMLLTLVVGCAGTGTSNPSGGDTSANENNAQLVVAMNPIFVYDDGEAVIPYNSIKNAMKTDFENATLTTLHQSTAWQWVYKTGEEWTARAIHTLDNWSNGSGARAKTVYSYGFTDKGTTSLASYYAQSTELDTYSETDSVPEYGLLLSVSGSEEEALTYTVQKDGVLNLAQGAFTAVRSVAGVNTGFLAEDGTARSASIRLVVNNTQVWSGTLCNATASPDGTAVTSLAYDQLSNMPVKAGDMIFIAVKLNATANKAEDQTAPTYNDEDNWTVVDKEVRVPITDKNNSGTDSTVKEEDDSLSILDDYLSRFVILRSSELAADMAQVAADMRTNMEYILDTEVKLRNETQDEELYEIVVGPMKERPESLKVYEELANYRVNNANDFLIRRVGTKVYITAVNAQSLEAAVDYFLRTFCSTEDGAVPAGYNYAFQAPTVAATIAGNPIGNYVIRVEKYPTTMVYRGAEELQTWVKENCGYLLPILPMTDDGKHYEYELQVGPMNGSVKVERAYDTRFTNATAESVGNYSVDPNGFMTDKDGGYYKAYVSGKHLVVNGGSPYAVNAAMAAIGEAIRKNKSLPRGYTLEGNYKAGNYSLTGGYDLKWQEEFSYTGTDADVEKEVREYWSLSKDTTQGPTQLGTDAAGNPIWDEQRRPDIYGENWWIWNDKSTGNGYLLEITKKESYGYDAVRLISAVKWAFRYGIWDTRIVVGTRNGACSAVWASSNQPDNVPLKNEIDLYENFGTDMLVPCYFTWYGDGSYTNHTHTAELAGNHVYPAEDEHFWDTFHSIAIEWTPEKMVFYWDGVQYDYMDTTEITSAQSSTTIKFANGVGTTTYVEWHKGDGDPDDWMNEAYYAKYGKTVEDFFEVQTIDYSHIFQTSNEGKNAKQQSYIKYGRTHPSSQYYTGYLSEIDGYVNTQLPQ